MNTIPLYEQQLILAHIIKKSREYVLAHNEIQLTKIQDTRYEELIKRRQNHEPMAYILGHKEFYGLDFKVTPDTLIPRPETEHLIDAVIGNLKLENGGNKKITIIDVGTGSGNIIISIAKSKEQRTKNKEQKKYPLSFFAVDISPSAIRVAKLNAKTHGVNKEIKFIKSDLLEYFIDHRFLITDHCIIVANLPYLSEEIYSAAMPDVKNFEPRSALLSGTDGLDHYKKLLSQIRKLKNTLYFLRTTCYLEISPEQKPLLQKLIKKYFPGAKIKFRKDLAGKWRVAQIEI